MSYGQRLKTALDHSGKGRKELAEAIGRSVQAVGDVINGKSKAFTAENNAKAAEFLKVNSFWLATGEGPMGNDKLPPAPAPAPHEAPSGAPGAPPDLVITEYDTGGAMGHGYALEENPPGHIKAWRVTPEWLRMNVPVYSSLANLCIVTGFGPSMKPRYNPGDPLLCDRGFNKVDSDGVYFFRVDGHGFIKQLQRIPTENGLILRAKSFNPDYDPFDITSKMDFEVFGKILTVWRSEQF